ncbi:ATP-binding protein [Micromonospora sp. PLK6-60]|uniref:ATP-binding protein n=1 Tax=Micromonospora sp. PLK6-60 TaxID=2873383 RepID=UPI00210780A1|nr:ATP-binding protein [Micromonospora sp. PLK6-60]
MPTDVPCLVETDGSSPVLHLTGALGPAGVPAVRDALLARLSERPGPVVVDLSRLPPGGPATRRVLAEVLAAVADWPAAGLVVCDPSGATAGVGALVCPTLDAALAAAPRPEFAQVDLPPVVGSARLARELVTEGCRRWGLPELAEPACIAVTELVNNVVAHAGTPMTVWLAPRAGTLHLAVRDHSPERPTFSGLAPVDTAGGRGLLLIDTVARRWGSSAVPDGKVVWCVLYAEDEASFRR